MDFDINNLMQQAQAMQEKMKKMQDEAANSEVVGESGAGLVKVTMNGRHDVKGVDIDASLMSEDKELLEDLLAAAVNDAVRRVEKQQQDNMQNMAGTATRRRDCETRAAGRPADQCLYLFARSGPPFCPAHGLCVAGPRPRIRAPVGRCAPCCHGRRAALPALPELC